MESGATAQQSEAAIQEILQKQQEILQKEQQLHQLQLEQQRQFQQHPHLGTGDVTQEYWYLQQHQQQLLAQQVLQHQQGAAAAITTATQQQQHQQQQQIIQQQQQLKQRKQELQQPQHHQQHQWDHRNANNVQIGRGNVGATNNNRAAPSAPPIPASNDAESAARRSDPLPNLERWSEYRIDAAKSITDLEAIRHRLLTLLGKTDSRLKEMRVQRALGDELGVNGGEKLSIKELVDMLSEQVEETSGSDVAEDSTTATTTGKRNHTEEESVPRKRQRCCPLCLGTSHLPSATNRSSDTQCVTTRSISCGVCEDNGICFKCHSRCLKCLKTICTDCFKACNKCNSSAYCSDCVDSGNGKCFPCCISEERAQKRAEKRAAEKKRKTPMSIVGGQVLVSETPSPRSKQCLTARGAIHQKQHGIDSLAELPALIPTHITVKPNEADSKSSESYAEHRFFLSGEIELVGCSVSPLVQGRVTLTNIGENSLAAKHGFQKGDELFVPGMDGDMIRKYFIASVKQPRPMIFHVKRFCSKPADGSTVHRFVVNGQGRLGVTIKKVGDTTMISSVAPGSLAEKHGIYKGDILCKPGTNGSEIEGMYDWFLNTARSNIPLFIFEAVRKKSVSPPPRYSFGNENPFLYRISEGSSAAAEAAYNENPAPVYNLLSSDESK